MLTILLAFVAGVITILSPCVLPLLPIILAGATGAGSARPAGIAIGFVGSFTIATLGLATAVSSLGLSPDIQRQTSVIVLCMLGLVMLVPQLHLRFESMASRWVPVLSDGGNGFSGAFTLGVGLGLAWTPCVGPIMASVMTLAMSQQIDSTAVLITLAFALGTVLPLMAIMLGGRHVVTKLSWFQLYGGQVQQVFGGLLIATALAIWFGLDRSAQAALVELLPSWDQMLTRW